MRQTEYSDFLKITYDFECLDLQGLKFITDFIGKSVSKKCFVNLEKKRFVCVELEDTLDTTDIENAIRSGNETDIISLTDLNDHLFLLAVYAGKGRLLFVKITDKFYLIKDKNNYRLVTQLLKRKEKKSKLIERKIEPLSLEGSANEKDSNSPSGKDSAPTDIKAVTESSSGNNGETDTYSEKSKNWRHKVLRPTSDSRQPNADKRQQTGHRRNGPVKVPPEENSSKTEVYFVNLFPYHGTEYRNGQQRGNSPFGHVDVKYSIQATDNACSLPSHDCFVSNVESRYRPTTSRSPPSSITTGNIVTTGQSRPWPRYKNMESSYARFDTFSRSDWHTHPNRPDIDTVVEWGFFYTELHDLVRCFQCGIGLKDWSIEDVVRDEHIRYSSDCAFLKEKLGQDNLNRLKLQLLYDTDDAGVPVYPAATRQQDPVVPTNSSFNKPDSSSYLHRMATSNDRSAAESAVSAHKPKQGTNKNASPKLPYPVRHTTLQSVESRLRTFQTFPPTVQQDHRKLAIAGFFYTGKGDICRCFCCDGGMQHWDPEDDPMQEHAKYFPECNYIRQIKGEEYIKNVQILRETAPEPTPITNAQTREQSPVASMANQMEGVTLTENRESPMPAQPGASDIYRSKIVKNVLESGFTQDQVKKAVESLVNTGNTRFTEDDIVNIILDNPTSEEQLGSNASVNDPEELLRENERLKYTRNCSICYVEESNILFLPCAHHKVCEKCSKSLKTCPVCSTVIDKKIKTYMS